MGATYPQVPTVLVRGCDRPSVDPVVRATTETTTPDLAAIAKLDAAIAEWEAGRTARQALEVAQVGAD